MTSAAQRAKLKDDHSSGAIGRSLTKLRPEGWPSKPCGDVTLALPHARWIILLTGRYEPKKKKKTGEEFTALTWRMSRRRDEGEMGKERIYTQGREVVCHVYLNKWSRFNTWKNLEHQQTIKVEKLHTNIVAPEKREKVWYCKTWKKMSKQETKPA